MPVNSLSFSSSVPVKQIPVKQETLVETRSIEKKSLIARTVQWIRKCEVGTTAERVGIFFVKFFGTLILISSIIGIPVFFDLYDEYVAQSIEEGYTALVEKLKNANLQIKASSEKTIGKMGQEINGLKEKLAIANENAKISKKEFSTLKDYLVELRKQLKEVEALNKTLSTDKESLQAQAKTQTKKLHDASSHILELSGLVQVYQQQKGQLKDRLASAQEAVVNLKDLLQKANQQKELLAKNLKQAEAESSHEQEGLRQLLEVQVQKIQELERTMASLQNRMQEDKETSTKLQTKLKVTTDRLAVKEAELKRAVEHIRARGQELEQLKKQQAEAPAQDFSAVFNKLGESDAALDKLQKEILALRQSATHTVEKLVKQQTFRLQAEVDELGKKLQEKGKDLVQCESTKLELEKALAAANDTGKDLAKKFIELQKTSKALEDENATLKNYAKAEHEATAQAQSKLHDALSDLETAKTRIHAMEEEALKRAQKIALVKAMGKTGINERLNSVENYNKNFLAQSPAPISIDPTKKETFEKQEGQIIKENGHLSEAIEWAFRDPESFIRILSQLGLAAFLEKVKNGGIEPLKVPGYSRPGISSLTSPKAAGKTTPSLTSPRMEMRQKELAAQQNSSPDISQANNHQRELSQKLAAATQAAIEVLKQENANLQSDSSNSKSQAFDAKSKLAKAVEELQALQGEVEKFDDIFMRMQQEIEKNRRALFLLRKQFEETLRSTNETHHSLSDLQKKAMDRQAGEIAKLQNQIVNFEKVFVWASNNRAAFLEQLNRVEDFVINIEEGRFFNGGNSFSQLSLSSSSSSAASPHSPVNVMKDALQRIDQNMSGRKPASANSANVVADRDRAQNLFELTQKLLLDTSEVDGDSDRQRVSEVRSKTVADYESKTNVV